jgi:nucleotide-binding universal stress UspA family protein
MLYFAYDGSINGDWVSHYAIRLACHDVDKRLVLIHVEDGETSPDDLAKKLGRIEFECQSRSVALAVQAAPLKASVFESLVGLVPPGRMTHLICGTRVRPRRLGYLAGTVSEGLLRSGRFRVLAVRVVQPGLLGLPRDFLIPMSGHPRGLEAALPFLARFAPDVASVRILLINEVSRSSFRRLSYERAARLRQSRMRYLERVERELTERLGLSDVPIDTRVAVSDDVPKEIVTYANRTRSRMIFMGASERSRTERFLYGDPIEQVLRQAPCDVAIYGGAP